MSDRRAPHLDDRALAALFDGALPEADATDARAHLDGCADCAARHAQVERAAERLRRLDAPRPHLATEVLARIDADESGEWGRRARGTGLVAAGALAGAIAAFVVVAPAAPLDVPRADEMTARGGGAANPNGLVLGVEVGASDGWRTVGVDGASVAHAAGTPAVRVFVDVLAPPKRPLYLAAYARDEGNAVTWLRPTWTVTSEVPRAEPLPSRPGRLEANVAVELVRPARMVEVGLALFDQPVAIDTLDAVLERGADLDDGGPAGLVRLQRRFLRVRRE